VSIGPSGADADIRDELGLMSIIVIVDDRVTNRNIFAKLAASIEPNVHVQSFGDPIEALDWLQNNTPDLIVTDYKMPHLDGAEFIRRFRAMDHGSEIPVVVITVYEERSFRLKALEAGATDFLSSPVDHYEFVTRARNLLTLRKHQLLLAQRADNLERELENSERSREMALRDSSERLAQVIDTLPVMISASAHDGKILFVNACQTKFFGLDHAECVGRPASLMLGEESGARSIALDRMVFETGTALPTFEEELTDAAGRKRFFVTTKSPLKDNESNVSGVLTSSLDITARKENEAHLHHLAHHDPLTDLPNRTLLQDRLRTLITRSRRGDQLFALHLLDLDGFKAVNDLFGHSAGDRFLRLIGQQLQTHMREADVLARLGGDEFAILQTNVANSDDAAEFARRITDVVQGFTGFEGGRVTTTASVGIAVHPADGADAEDLLKNADLAMYKAKAEGGNAFCFYAADMQARARHAANLDAELRTAVAEDQFVLFYQPQIDLVSGRVVGAEALLRWNRPGLGIVGPGVFLSRAEENGLILPINEWVLREACREAKNWHRSGLGRPRVSVNLSPIQFRRRSVPLLVAQVLGETGLDPHRLDLELTESILMEDLESVAHDLRQLLDLGVSISIDDFGTGYSSLSYVKRLPVTRIKIDQSFIRNMAQDQNDAAIVRAIVQLGHSLELVVVAEGVETADQLAKLREEGCDEVQGFYFGRPMPAAQFQQVLAGDVPLARSA
jgi:diguanylate cyclase (GGDEF)-like protein/PAS domain S-box-containing protein